MYQQGEEKSPGGAGQEASPSLGLRGKEKKKPCHQSQELKPREGAPGRSCSHRGTTAWNVIRGRGRVNAHQPEGQGAWVKQCMEKVRGG